MVERLLPDELWELLQQVVPRGHGRPYLNRWEVLAVLMTSGLLTAYLIHVPINARPSPVERDDLATMTPYIQHTIRRMGDLVLNLTPPEQAPATRLDLEPRVLFAPRT
jgi:hypothetical protein